MCTMSSSGERKQPEESGNVLDDVVKTNDEPIKDEPAVTYTRTKTKEVTEAYVYSDKTYVDKKKIDRELDRIDELIAERRKELDERMKIARQFRENSEAMKSISTANAKGEVAERTDNTTIWIYRISVLLLLLLAIYNYFIDFRPCFMDEYRLTS